MGRLLSVLVGLAIGSSPAWGTVNCDLVRKNLTRPGATVEDVSMTMVIPEEEIRKCLDEAEEANPEDDAAKKAED